MKKLFQSRKFRGGAYATAISALTIVFVILVNLLVSGVSKDVDLTASGKFSISDDSIRFLKNMKTKVTMYYVTEEGKEDRIILASAEQIAEHCSSVSMEYKDPIQYPQFIYGYNDMSEIKNNSIILVNEEDPDRYCYLDYEDLIISTISSDFTKKVLSGYDAELEIIKGIVSITGEASKRIYVTNNHKEYLTGIDQDETTGEKTNAPTLTFQDLFGLNGYDVKTLNLTQAGTVPKDCDMLIIGGLQADLTETEVSILKDYVTNGGKVMLALGLGNYTYSNLASLLGYYGLKLENGIVCDGDTARTEGSNPSFLLCSYKGQNAEFPQAAYLTVVETINTQTIEMLCTTSSKGYIKLDPGNLVQTGSEPTGEYPLMLTITDTFAGKSGTLTIMTTPYFMADVFMSGRSPYSNRMLLIDTVNGLTGSEEFALSIPETTAFEEALTMTDKEKNLVLIGSFALPAIFLIAGIVVFFRRRVEKV